MEGLNTLQGKHEEGRFPPLSATGFIISPWFYWWRRTIYVHKGTSGVFWGGFLELLKDSGPGSPVMYVMYVSITLIQWNSQKWDSKIVVNFLGLDVLLEEHAPVPAQLVQKDVGVWMSVIPWGQDIHAGGQSFPLLQETSHTFSPGIWVRRISSCTRGLCNAWLCGLPRDIASFSTVVQGSGLYLSRHLKQVTRCYRLTKALHIASCAI